LLAPGGGGGRERERRGAGTRTKDRRAAALLLCSGRGVGRLCFASGVAWRGWWWQSPSGKERDGQGCYIMVAAVGVLAANDGVACAVRAGSRHLVGGSGMRGEGTRDGGGPAVGVEELDASISMPRRGGRGVVFVQGGGGSQHRGNGDVLFTSFLTAGR
jgi:hypothetical protein